MKFLNENQIKQLNSFIINQKHNTSKKRDLLLVSLSVNAGIKPAHLAEMKVNDILDQTTGEVVLEVKTGTTKTPLTPELRTQIADYLTSRFYQDHRALRGVTLHLASNREERGYFTDQSMASHLTALLKKSGINATSMALRNTYIHRVASSEVSFHSLVRMTAIKNATTAVRYLTSDYSEVTQLKNVVF